MNSWQKYKMRRKTRINVAAHERVIASQREQIADLTLQRDDARTYAHEVQMEVDKARLEIQMEIKSGVAVVAQKYQKDVDEIMVSLAEDVATIGRGITWMADRRFLVLTRNVLHNGGHTAPIVAGSLVVAFSDAKEQEKVVKADAE